MEAGEAEGKAACHPARCWRSCTAFLLAGSQAVCDTLIPPVSSPTIVQTGETEVYTVEGAC